MNGEIIKVLTSPRMNCTRCNSMPSATPRTSCTARAVM